MNNVGSQLLYDFVKNSVIIQLFCFTLGKHSLSAIELRKQICPDVLADASLSSQKTQIVRQEIH